MFCSGLKDSGLEGVGFRVGGFGGLGLRWGLGRVAGTGLRSWADTGLGFGIQSVASNRSAAADRTDPCAPTSLKQPNQTLNPKSYNP